MPTPFTHIQIAESILDYWRLKPSSKLLAEKYYPAFYLGNIAPDFQTICDIPRAETHFYDLPPDLEKQPHETMLAQYPVLADAAALSGEQAVFVAGYCAHLMFDMLWYREVLIPYFVASPEWNSHHERFIVHNTLLTYLDKLAVISLPKKAAATLTSATPVDWLPFAGNGDLIQWRDVLVEQLRPGAPLQTINIYAGRLFMSPAEFEANLNRADWMDKNLFGRVSVEDVQNLLTTAVSKSADWISEYLTRLDRNQSERIWEKEVHDSE